MRTIAHNKIWEGSEPYCHYEGQNYDIIKKWEPEISNYTFDKTKIGIGIYTETYFNYTSMRGIRASTDTIQESQPSLLKLKSIDGNPSSSIEDKSGIIKIAFELTKKFDTFDKVKMFELDTMFVRSKKKELGAKLPITRFDSLCFSLDEQEVDNLLKQFGVSLIVN